MAVHDRMIRKGVHPHEWKSVAVFPLPDRNDRGFRPNGLEKVDLHKADTDPPDQWRLRMPVSTFGWLFERRRAVQIYLAGINSTIPLITQRKYSQIQLATKKTSPIIPGSTGGTFLHQAPLQGVRAKRGGAGSGERGRMPIEQSSGKTLPVQRQRDLYKPEQFTCY